MSIIVHKLLATEGGHYKNLVILLIFDHYAKCVVIKQNESEFDNDISLVSEVLYFNT